MALAQGVQTKLICDLCCIHGIWKILLVSKHKQHGIAQLILHVESQHELPQVGMRVTKLDGKQA